MVVSVGVRNSRPLAWSNALERGSVGSHGVGNSLGVNLERIGVEVVDGIADLVVVDVVRDALLATEQSDLLSGLETFSSSVDTTSSNTSIEEGAIVAAAAEFDFDAGDLGNVGVVVREELLGLGGSLRTRLTKGAAVTVVHAESVVGASNHVKVEVEADLVLLSLGKVLDVVLGAEQTELLSRPPSEANGVLDAEAREGGGNLEEGRRARAIVVNTGAGSNRVTVRAEHNDVVLVTSLGLDDDVVRGSVLDGTGELQVSIDRLAGREAGKDGFTLSLGETSHGDECALRTGALASKRTSDGTLSVVVDDNCIGTSRASECDLESKVAGTSLDERDTVQASGEVGRNASTVGDSSDRSGVKLAVGAVGECGWVLVLAINGELSKVLGKGGGERLKLNVVVLAERLEVLGDVVYGLVVTLGAKDTVAVGRAVGDALKVAGALEEAAPVDSATQGILKWRKRSASVAQFGERWDENTYRGDRRESLIARGRGSRDGAGEKEGECYKGELHLGRSLL